MQEQLCITQQARTAQNLAQRRFATGKWLAWESISKDIAKWLRLTLLCKVLFYHLVLNLFADEHLRQAPDYPKPCPF